jgi:hypothetical protein
VTRSEALNLAIQACEAAGWTAVPVPGQKAVRATCNGRTIELRVSVLGPNSRGQWLKRTLRVGPDMFACPIIDGVVYLIASEEWLVPSDVLGSAEYPSKPSEPEWTMSRRSNALSAFLESHEAVNVLLREAERPASITDPVLEAQVVAVETSNVEAMHRQTVAASTAAIRRESRLVARYVEYLQSEGHTVARLKHTTTDGETLYSDVWLPDLRLLIEAKADAGRPSVRMALGQLIDYARALSNPCHRAVLLPEAPTPDILNLIRAGGAEAIWSAEGSFRSSADEWSAPT